MRSLLRLRLIREKKGRTMSNPILKAAQEERHTEIRSKVFCLVEARAFFLYCKTLGHPNIESAAWWLYWNLFRCLGRVLGPFDQSNSLIRCVAGSATKNENSSSPSRGLNT